MSTPPDRPILVVIAGPIASGKPTVANALAGRLQRSARAVAVLGLDDVVEALVARSR